MLRSGWNVVYGVSSCDNIFTLATPAQAAWGFPEADPSLIKGRRNKNTRSSSRELRMKLAPQPSFKKPYQQPALKLYGTLSSLTGNVGRGGRMDGGMFLHSRTH
jgi:hypothetical protein